MRLGKYLSWVNGLHWGHLRALGNSRLVGSSIAWLFIVPIAAKLLAPFAGQHTLDLSWFDPGLDEPIIVTIALPFSWKLFYLMSWLFVIGQAVYWLACPEIVRKYANYGDYRRDHTGARKLGAFGLVAARRSTAAALKMIMLLPRDQAKSESPEEVSHAVLRFLHHSQESAPEGTDIRQNRVFDVVLGAELEVRRLWFWVSGVFFAGGLVLFAWVVCEGVAEVRKLL